MSALELPEGIDLADLRPAIIDVAERVLTTRQLEIFVLHFFAEQSVSEVARCVGVARQVVSEAINGKEGRHPGILKRMGEALKNDPAFQETLNALKQPANQRMAKGVDVVGWYKGCQPHHFSALALLHYALSISDVKDQLTIDDLFAHIPKGAVGQSLSMLKVLGFVAFDGRTITILKTPLSGEKERH